MKEKLVLSTLIIVFFGLGFGFSSCVSNQGITVAAEPLRKLPEKRMKIIEDPPPSEMLLWIKVRRGDFRGTLKEHDTTWNEAAKLCAPKSVIPILDEFYEGKDKGELLRKYKLKLEFTCQ